MCVFWIAKVAGRDIDKITACSITNVNLTDGAEYRGCCFRGNLRVSRNPSINLAQSLVERGLQKTLTASLLRGKTPLKSVL